MNETQSIQEALLGVWNQLAGFAVDFVPRLATGLLVFLIGVIVARILERVLRSTLSRARFDSAMERVGITSMLASLGLHIPLSRALGRLTYYLLVILFLRGAADAVGLGVISAAINTFFSYLPSLFAAVLILLLGNVVAQVARTVVQESASGSGVDYAPALGRAVSGVILFIAAIMAITQLGIDTAMIRTIVIAVLAAVSGAFALSFGLGTRQITRNIVAGFYARKLFRIGDSVEVRGARGILVGITPTQTLVEEGTTTVSVANSAMLDEDVRQKQAPA